jgi:hypothetical protein
MAVKAISPCFRFGLLACLAVCSLAASEHHGVVKFGSVPVPGATVTATQGDKKAVAVTDSSGAYAFPDLADGVWSIQVEMLCFSKVTKEVGVAPGAPAAEWALQLLPMEEIKASLQTPAAPPANAAAPAAAQGAAQTAAPQTAPAKPAKGGKNGKSTAAAANPQSGYQRTDVNASGDAAAAPATPSIVSADAAQGAQDAFVVNGSSSSGIERRAIGNARKGPGSLFNGGFSFVFDNSVLNARNYSLTGQDTPKTPYNHFTVGANVGGPLYIPHVFHWQGNFYLNYQTTRNRNAQNATALMPTQAERDGDFSNVTDASGKPITLLDGSNKLQTISPQAASLLNFYPLPQFAAAGGSYNYQAALISRTSVDSVQGRVNKFINTKSSLQTSFGYQNSRSQTPNIFNFVDGNNTVGMQATASYRRTFSRQLFGTFGVQYSRQSVRATPALFSSNVSHDARITGNDQSAGNSGPPTLTFSNGIQTLQDGNPTFNRNQTTAFSANMSWIRRPHNMTFGGDWRIQDFSLLGEQNGRGTFGFDGTATGFAFADFLAGIPDTVSIAKSTGAFGSDRYLKAGSYDLFFTDDWRVSPSLTLNAGVRWEYGSPITEKYGRLVNLDIAPGFASSAPVLASNPTGSLTHLAYPDSLVNPDKHAIQPRISFAWKPIFGASTVVRGGYGIYYNTSVYRTLVNYMVQQSPLSDSLSVSNPGNLTLANGFLPSPTDTFALDPKFKVGYSQNWTLSVQQNVTASMVLTATYLGIKGTRAPQAFLPNTYPEGAVNPCPSCLPGYTYVTSNGNSTRHAGQINLRRRFHGGLSTTLQYTYSKAIDDTGALGGGASQSIAQNWLNLAGERGFSNFDQRHLAGLQLQYSTGVGVHGGALLSGWRGLIFKGWTFLSSITAGSGTPLSPVYLVPTQGTGTTGTVRPEYLGGDIYHAPAGRSLNPLAYSAPPSGQWGNAARNSIIGPTQFSMNASMQRSFADNIDVRFDSTNTLNHPTYTSWNTTWNSGLFGVANPPGAMRVIQATLRWRF